MESLEQELESSQDFMYIEYTFIPDPEFNELNFPLKLYEIKVPTSANGELLRQRLREKHEIPDEDGIYVTDNWKWKIHRQICEDYEVIDIVRATEDIFVYHKRKCETNIAEIQSIKLLNDNYEHRYQGLDPEKDRHQHVHVIDNLRLEEREVTYYDAEYDPNVTKRKMDGTEFAMPLLIRFIDKRAEIPMKELFRKLCKCVQTLTKDGDLRRELNLALNMMKTDNMELLIFGYIRINMDKECKLEMPMELKIMILHCAKFDIEEELPFELKMRWGFNNCVDITSHSDEIVTFDKRNKKFQVIWDDVSKSNDGFCERKNRLPVDIDFE